ncbi:uncharacterized protein LOC131288466 [Anopheles ziemanni]|nr:uncharacterized protein LOC131288466 [Anopheles ziemanni]
MGAKMFNIIIGIAVLAQLVAGDDLGLLSSTLRAFRTVCCDDELLTLSCPIGTSISVELVQYGSKESNDTVQCSYSEADGLPYSYVPETPPFAPVTLDFSTVPLANATFAPTTATVAVPSSDPVATLNETFTAVDQPKDKCTPLYVLQYSILQTVVEACQKKRRCRILASPKNFAAAPCAGIHRMVEVNHKCRPFEFRSLISCEKDIVRLTCGQYTRIAIYSASYGRTAYESTHCTQTAASQEQTCLSEHTSHTLTEICQGRRKCTVAVESSTFGNPCPENARTYLKVIYACVSRNVFRERYITPLEEDELDERPYESNELYDEELTPAPNQIESTGKGGVGTSNHNKYSSVGGGGDSAVKAENIVTFSKGAGTGSGQSADDHSAALGDGQLLIVAVAVLFFCCLCLSFGALLAYRMKLFPGGGNRCIKASESSDSQSTPSSYRAPSEDFDLVECMPDTAAMAEKHPEQTPMQTFVQPVSTPIPVTSVPATTLLPAFKFAEPRGSLSQISTTMFILPNYLMGPGPVSTLPNRRPNDTLAALPPGDNLTITLTTADISGPNSKVDPRRESMAFYSHPQPPHQHRHHPPYGPSVASCAQCAILGGWNPSSPIQAGINPPNTNAAGTISSSSSPPVFGGKLLALENPATSAGQTSHPYHRNQSLNSSTGDADERMDGAGPCSEEPNGGGRGTGRALTQQHSFLWLGLKVGLM